MAVKNGLADALMIILDINLDQYKPENRFSGVHINLHAQCSHAKGACPEEFSSNLMVSPGRARFFRMKKVRRDCMRIRLYLSYFYLYTFKIFAVLAALLLCLSSYILLK